MGTIITSWQILVLFAALFIFHFFLLEQNKLINYVIRSRNEVTTEPI